MTEHVIQIKDLVQTRGSFRLSVPSWQLNPGTVSGVVGPNGAGKTTLLRLLPGLDRRNAGQLNVLGLDPSVDPAQVRQVLGFMSDDQPLFRLRVDKLLWTLSGYWPNWDQALVSSLVTRFEIDLRKKVGDLSRGEGTRLRLVCAMAFQPRVLVLDEPAAGLDLGGRRRLLETVLDVVRDPQRSVVISSHQLGDLQRIADELLVINEGEVVRQGATDELVGNHQTLDEAMVAWGAAG